MKNAHVRPEDGDLYKLINIGPYTFELRYGYYTESDRAFGEPAVIFPDLSQTRLYLEDGARIVTAVQDPCLFYNASDSKANEKSCIDCIYYSPPGDDIGVCQCVQNHKNMNEQDDLSKEDVKS